MIEPFGSGIPFVGTVEEVRAVAAAPDPPNPVTESAVEPVRFDNSNVDKTYLLRGKAGGFAGFGK